MTTEELLDEVYNDSIIVMGEVTEAYARAKHLLDDPRIIRFYQEDLETMSIEITNALSRMV